VFILTHFSCGENPRLSAERWLTLFTRVHNENWTHKLRAVRRFLWQKRQQIEVAKFLPIAWFTLPLFGYFCIHVTALRFFPPLPSPLPVIFLHSIYFNVINTCKTHNNNVEISLSCWPIVSLSQSIKNWNYIPCVLHTSHPSLDYFQKLKISP
jgi:hypothetical protein